MPPTIRQIQERNYSGPALTEGACIFRTPATLKLDQPVEWESYQDDGLGQARVAVFETIDGGVFALEHHEESPRSDLTVIYVRPENRGIQVDNALTALGLGSADLAWLAEGLSLQPARLTRLDDNGVQFHVGDYPCRADAEVVVARLSAGAHKQTYFVEPLQAGGPTLRFPDDFRSPPSICPA